MSAGTVITGGVLSTRVIVTLNVVGAAALPWASVALHVTVVCPTGKFEPEAGAHVTATEPSTRSVAVGFVYVIVFPPGFDVVSVMSPCAAITGGVVSVTTTSKLEGAETSPSTFVSVHVTVV